MIQLRINKFAKIAFQAVILIISVFLINACSLPLKQSPPINNESLQKKSAWKLPIRIPKGEFSKVGGWLSDEELVYITNKEQTSSIFSYNLSSGKSNLLYRSEFPVGFVQISPSKRYILVQSSPSTYEGKITIIDLQGNEKFSQVIPSYQLSFEWNPYQESQIIISKFQEDWTFQVMLLDFEKKNTKELALPQPFFKWMDKDQLAYLDWDNDQQKLLAPLVIHSLSDGSQKSVFQNIFQFTAFKNVIMTITVNGKDDSKATYSFYNQSLQRNFSFSMPQLRKFSDWLVPFYDFNEKQQKFITFRPLKSGAADTYKSGFVLASYNLKNRKSTVLMKGLDNQPLALSPSGEATLYGNRFEKIINLKTKKIIAVVKE